MQLSLKATTQNSFPLGALLIKGQNPMDWLIQMQAMELSLEQNKAYPIPDLSANSLWGCIVLLKNNGPLKNIGQNSYCQKVSNSLYIAELAELRPSLSAQELEKLLIGHSYVLHPSFGLVCLEKPIHWESLIVLPNALDSACLKPIQAPNSPEHIKSFEVHALPFEEILKQMNESLFPEHSGNLEDKPLSALEKMRLQMLKALFKEGKEDSKGTDKTGLMKGLESLGKALGGGKGGWSDKMMQDFEALERRNQKNLDKLLELFRKNPEEALKYAIPLDNGIGRGATGGPPSDINLDLRWFSFLFSMFPDSSSSGGGSSGVIPGKYFDQLQDQYRKTALELIKKGEFQKAAFIYMKLLKNHLLAAQTLEQGALYAEAAAVYLKFLDNKPKAAECYEKGNMFSKSIDLYKELKEHEKVGDLYMALQQREEAVTYYQLVIDDYLEKKQYLKASFICKDKIDNLGIAQELLLMGWQENEDAFNCLNNYFNNIQDQKVLSESILYIYKSPDMDGRYELFLRAIKEEFKKHPEQEALTRELAFEIVSDLGKTQPRISSELAHFNPENKKLSKDINRFVFQRKG